MANLSDGHTLPPDWTSLPEHLWLTIFSKCLPSDLLSIKQVCHQWWRIANDFTLTSQLVVNYKDDKRLQNQTALNELLVFAADHLTTLFINGFLAYKRTRRTWSKVKMSDQVMSTLQDKCRHLRRLALVRIHSDITYDSLPSHLTHLWLMCLTGCDHKLLTPLIDTYDKYQSIVYLNLSFSHDFESQLCRSLNQFSSLRYLYLEDLSRVNDCGITDWNQSMISRLVVLDIEGTDISDQSFQYILKNANSLEEFFLGSTNIFGNFDLTESVAKKLKKLCILKTKIGLTTLRDILKYHARLVSVNCDQSLNEAINSPIVFTEVKERVEDSCLHYTEDNRFFD